MSYETSVASVRPMRLVSVCADPENVWKMARSSVIAKTFGELVKAAVHDKVAPITNYVSDLWHDAQYLTEIIDTLHPDGIGDGRSFSFFHSWDEWGTCMSLDWYGTRSRTRRYEISNSDGVFTLRAWNIHNNNPVEVQL